MGANKLIVGASASKDKGTSTITAPAADSLLSAAAKLAATCVSIFSMTRVVGTAKRKPFSVRFSSLNA